MGKKAGFYTKIVNSKLIARTFYEKQGKFISKAQS